MQGNDITSAPDPEADGSYIGLVVDRAVEQIAPFMLAGVMKVQPVTLPVALGRLRPVCAWTGSGGEHRIANRLVWKDLDTNEAYCQLECAAEHAVRMDARPEAEHG